MRAMGSMLVLSRQDVRSLLDPDELLEAVARESRDTGHELPHYLPFVAAHEQLLRLKDDFERRWPFFRADVLKAKLAEPAEFVDAEEIYREFPELRHSGPK